VALAAFKFLHDRFRFSIGSRQVRDSGAFSSFGSMIDQPSGKILYRDPQHLNIDGPRYVADRIRPFAESDMPN
jgi:hypothetical protein